MRKAMTIGQVAKAAGVGVETIRYYQRRRLLTIPSKSSGSPRQYADGMVRQIAFIRRAQLLGFSLEEIRALLTISDGRNCSAGRAFAEGKIEELGRRVDELNRMRRQLRQCVKGCEANTRGGAPCPFIATLNGEGD
jgi:MerR family mercuric resistance operon transcriptional regulator